MSKYYYVKQSDLINDYIDSWNTLNNMNYIKVLSVKDIIFMEKLKFKLATLDKLFSDIIITVNDEYKYKFCLKQNKVKLTRLVSNIQRNCIIRNIIFKKEIEDCFRTKFIEIDIEKFISLYKEEEYDFSIYENKEYLKVFFRLNKK